MSKFLRLLRPLIWLSALCAFAGEKPELDPETGFVKDPDLVWVKANCTNCHSAKLVTQNRGTEQDWLDLIRYMQAEQGLWPIEAAMEKKIIAYLGKYYGPEKTGRRKPLVMPARKKDGDGDKR